MIAKTLLIRSTRVARQSGLRFVTTEDIQKYKTDSASLAQWLDVSIVSRKGRAFDASRSLIHKSDADSFPMTKVYALNGQNVTIPDHIDAKAKLVVFSFKHYGFSLVRSWLDPFIAKYNVPQLPADQTSTSSSQIKETGSTKRAMSNPNGAVAYEICFVEYSFLSMAKSVFASNIKQNVNPEQVERTGLVFGNVKEFAAPLLLPNVYTGYAYLLDKDNKIRWKGSGQALEGEVETLLQCTEELLKER